MIHYQQIPSPCFVLDEARLRNNLALIRDVQDRSGAQIILAFKAFAMWSAFPIIREYIPYCIAVFPVWWKIHTYDPQTLCCWSRNRLPSFPVPPS